VQFYFEYKERRGWQWPPGRKPGECRLSLYANGWETCIDDLLNLTCKSAGRDNQIGVVFYLRVACPSHELNPSAHSPYPVPRGTWKPAHRQSPREPGWETCIDDLLNLTCKSAGRDNQIGVVFYLRVLGSARSWQFSACPSHELNPSAHSPYPVPRGTWKPAHRY
jgi:hypothetical protein